MDTITLSPLAVVAASVVAFVANFAWFGPRTFFPVWQRALGMPDHDPADAGTSMVVVFGLTTLAVVTQAVVMAVAVQAVAVATGAADVSLGLGALVGAVIGIAFAAAPSLGHRLFSGQGLVVWVIEVGADILGLVLIGATLSFWY